MEKNLLTLLMVLTISIGFIACGGGDDDERLENPLENKDGNGDNENDNNTEGETIVVIVNEDGTTSNGSLFSYIDDHTFYIDYIKYSVQEGHLVVTGCDKTGFKGIAKFISKLSYKDKTYEVLAIGEKAFYNCSTLTSVTIPNSVRSIGNQVFKGCVNLTSITIPNSVTTIGKETFAGCNNLESVTIGRGLTSISEMAFYATGLKAINIPNNITSIGSGAFYACI